MEIVTITTMVGVITLVVEKFYDYLTSRKKHICKSECCGAKIESETEMK